MMCTTNFYDVVHIVLFYLYSYSIYIHGTSTTLVLELVVCLHDDV
jgi:hypothetical protein